MNQKLLKLLVGRKASIWLLILIFLLHLILIFGVDLSNDIQSCIFSCAILICITLLLVNILASKNDVTFRSIVFTLVVIYLIYLGYSIWSFLSHVD
jgi:hypothetical protein